VGVDQRSDMKVVVIAGGGRESGKTTLATALRELLPDSRSVKLGHHRAKEGTCALLFPLDTPYREILSNVERCSFLIIESGAILDDLELQADLVIFLPSRGGRGDKSGSERRRARADLVRGKPVATGQVERLRRALGVDHDVFDALLKATGVSVEA
jgi:hypothetical protein